MKPSSFPYLVLTFGVIAVSSASILIKLCEAPPLVIATYRMLFASLCLLPFLVTSDALRQLKTLSRQEKSELFASGFCLGLHFAFWITSLSYTSVASSVVLVSMNPLFVGLASPIVLGEGVPKRVAIGIIVAVTGAIFIGLEDFTGREGTLYGNILALFGAVTVSAYFLIGRRLRQHLSLIPYIFAVYTIAAFVLTVMTILNGFPLYPYSSQAFLIFFLLALGPTLLGHSSFNWALKYLTASLIAVTILGEPVGAAILAYLILGETLTISKMGSGALILGGIYLATSESSSSIGN